MMITIRVDFIHPYRLPGDAELVRHALRERGEHEEVKRPRHIMERVPEGIRITCHPDAQIWPRMTTVDHVVTIPWANVLGITEIADEMPMKPAAKKI